MRKWGIAVQCKRMLWAFAWPAFRLSPRPLWGWRRMLLTMFGARIGSGAHIYPTVRIMMPWNIVVGADAAIGDRAIIYALGTISIGERATVSQGAHLCAGTHDIYDIKRPLLTPPILIEREAWICADAFVGPGVTIGEGSILGARAVAMKSVPAGVVAVGNPAHIIKPARAENMSRSEDGPNDG